MANRSEEFERYRQMSMADEAGYTPPGASHVGCCGTNKRGEGCTSCAPENAAETRSVMHQVRQPRE
jgi:hypothetical protein